MTEQIILIISAIAAFISAIYLNSKEIFGFYYACKFEYGNDKLSFDAEIESGKLFVMANWIKVLTVEKSEHPIAKNQSSQFYETSIAQDSVLTFEPASPDAIITISNIFRRKTIDEKSKEILWKIKYYFEKWFGEFATKPICGCPVCMSSYHSFFVWIPLYVILPFSFWFIYVHAMYICILAGVNYLKTADRNLDL